MILQHEDWDEDEERKKNNNTFLVGGRDTLESERATLVNESVMQVRMRCAAC